MLTEYVTEFVSVVEVNLEVDNAEDGLELVDKDSGDVVEIISNVGVVKYSLSKVLVDVGEVPLSS